MRRKRRKTEGAALPLRLAHSAGAPCVSGAPRARPRPPRKACNPAFDSLCGTRGELRALLIMFLVSLSVAEAPLIDGRMDRGGPSTAGLLLRVLEKGILAALRGAWICYSRTAVVVDMTAWSLFKVRQSGIREGDITHSRRGNLQARKYEGTQVQGKEHKGVVRFHQRGHMTGGSGLALGEGAGQAHTVAVDWPAEEN